jgi:hypothetical protein
LLPKSASALIEAEKIQKTSFFTNNEQQITNTAELSLLNSAMRP